jgi:hypothetical protein
MIHGGACGKGRLVSEATEERRSARPNVALAFDLLLRGLAALLALSLVIAGWRDVSQAYDVWYYHLPFAARIAGVVDARSYAFSADNQARFEGFPLAGEALQGLVWRLTGHIEATSFVSLAALFALPFCLRRMFGVPLHLALLALLAIPLVHIHATSSYVDLLANACVTMLLLCVFDTLRSGTPPTWKRLVAAAALAALAANTKFQLVPIVGLASGALFVLALRGPAVKRRLVVLVIALPVVLATPIKNAAVHGNPVWPIELKVLGRSLPHVEEAYGSSPQHLANTWAPMRFVRSVLEIDNRPIATHARWSLDQWTPPDEPGYRMGGYFGAFVVLNVLALAAAVWRRRDREAIVAGAMFAGVTVVASLVPQCHELRYYMHWMLFLVALNLVLWTRRGPARGIVGAVAVAALAVVTWSTEGGYLYASGKTFAELVASRTDRSVIESAAPGERLCIARQPFTFLYAPAFNGRNDYAVQEATVDADCKDARKIP